MRKPYMLRGPFIPLRCLSQTAEKHGCLAPEQYGSRKKHMAIEHALNKRLTFDILRQQRLPAVWCANDAKSCYDQIVHSVASLCMQRCGVQEAPALSMFKCIQQLRHHIRTAYGTSTRWFGGDDQTVIPHGIGQGNGAGPAIWAVVSTPVLNMLRDEGFGVQFQSSITHARTHLWRMFSLMIAINARRPQTVIRPLTNSCSVCRLA